MFFCFQVLGQKKKKKKRKENYNNEKCRSWGLVKKKRRGKGRKGKRGEKEFQGILWWSDLRNPV